MNVSCSSWSARTTFVVRLAAFWRSQARRHYCLRCMATGNPPKRLVLADVITRIEKRSPRMNVHPRHHGHDHAEGGHGHTHGIINPSITTSGKGLWAIKWSFIGLAATAALQLVVVIVSGSVALLADTIHNFA